jgi:Domain of unknown function (DUF4174)
MKSALLAVTVALGSIFLGAIAFSQAVPAPPQVLEPAQDPAPDPENPPQLALDAYLWLKRPIVVFADAPNDPRFIRQLELLGELKFELDARDVVILTDTNPSAKSDLREKLRPRGFMLVLLGKDGQVKLRKPFPWTVREIIRVIDNFPLRLQEIRAR